MSEKLIPDAAVKAIKDSVVTEVISVNGRDFTTRQVFETPKDPTPNSLELNTLTGLIEYVNKGPDVLKDHAQGENGLAIHVVDEAQVDVISGLFGNFEQRKIYATASARQVLDGHNFTYGQFLDSETFIIKLQALFAPTVDRENVLKVVGNIKEENVRQTEDDGITQTVTAKTGIARVGEVHVPNPVNLAPYRTFREIFQPSSPFVLRVRQGREGNMPSVALFESDGGAWKLEAIEAIRAFLGEKITEVPIIA